MLIHTELFSNVSGLGPSASASKNFLASASASLFLAWASALASCPAGLVNIPIYYCFHGHLSVQKFMPWCSSYVSEKIRVGSDPLRLATESTVSVIFLQFLCRQVDKLDLERSFEMLNAILQFDSRFYRAMLCIRGTSHGPVSVCPCPCPSVTSRSSTKTAKRRITQTTPHDTPKDSSFLMPKISAKLDRGHPPYEGAKRRWGGSKSATFDK